MNANAFEIVYSYTSSRLVSGLRPSVDIDRSCEGGSFYGSVSMYILDWNSSSLIEFIFYDRNT